MSLEPASRPPPPTLSARGKLLLVPVPGNRTSVGYIASQNPPADTNATHAINTPENARWSDGEVATVGGSCPG